MWTLQGKFSFQKRPNKEKLNQFMKERSTSNVNFVTKGNLKKTLEILKSHSDLGFKIA